MMTPPFRMERTSSSQVVGFRATMMSRSLLRAVYPFLLMRTVYQVGRPAILEGKRFLAPTGMPMRNKDLSRMLLADCEPLPFTVAAQILQSLTMISGILNEPFV